MAAKKEEGWRLVETERYLKAMSMNGGNSILNGNEAAALGALVAGCRFFAGYPITPSSGILSAMTRCLPSLGGAWYAPEDEIASIGMCIATSLCGRKAMTATSGPGFSLMQEEFGMAILNEVPLVVIDAMRVGPSTGQATKPSVADINCMIHGRHGDAGDAVVILSPRSVQECFSMTVAAFNISEEWRTPVFVALDGYLSQLEERVCIPEQVYVYDRIGDRGEPPFGANGMVSNFVSVGGIRPQAYTGALHDALGSRSSYLPEVAESYIAHLMAKHRSIIPSIQKDPHYSLFEKENSAKDSELLLVSYGVASRAGKDAAKQLRSERIKALHLNLPILWPLHADMFETYKNIPQVVVVENNTGQLVPFIAPHFSKAKISSFAKWNGTPIQTGELVCFCRQLFRKEETGALEMGSSENKKNITLAEPLSELQGIFSSILPEDWEEAENKIAVEKPYPFCPGCGHQSFIDVLLPVLAECGLSNENTIFVSGIGCGSIVPATFNGHLVKTSHGRALNAARAIKLAYPERTVIVISGDGDLGTIGGNHLIHTVRDKYRFPIICFCLDNANYGMTGGQPSATTPQAATTALSSLEPPPPFDLKKLLYDGCGIDFFARVSVADHEYLSQVTGKAIAASRKTFAFVQVFSHCTTHFVKNNRELFSREMLAGLRGTWERE
ncbi:MAG: hypothetical protein HZC04_00250 [Candidatus Lloydbacteria bacterium]|nr:hypothetical protein [Candidatus Lloydbacteria bacterium]